MMMDTQAILTGLAEVLERPTITPDSPLAGGPADWDSLAIVSTIALIDEYAGVQVAGTALAACVTVDDVLRLIAAAPAA